MFDYITINEGTYNLLITILLIILFWSVVRFYSRPSIVFKVIMVYILIGFACAILFYSLSQYKWYAFEAKDIKMEPLLYLSILFCIMALPFNFLKIQDIKYIDDFGIEKVLKYFSICLFILSILPFIESFIRLFSINSQSLVAAYEGGEKNSSLFVYYSNQARNYLTFFIVPLFFYFLYKGAACKIYFYYISFALFTSVLLAFTGGGRGTMVNQLNYLVFCYIVFSKFIHPRIKTKIKKMSFIGVGVVITLLLIITLARADFSKNKSNAASLDLITWISLYLGQGPLEFSRQMYPSTVRTEGDNSFPLIKTTLGLKTFKENNERREYWERKQAILNYIFYTVIGDIYSDLGYDDTILFIVFLSIVMSIYIHKCSTEKISMQSIIIISLYFEWVSMGFMNNCFKTYYYQFHIFVTCVILALLSILQRQQRRR